MLHRWEKREANLQKHAHSFKDWMRKFLSGYQHRIWKCFILHLVNGTKHSFFPSFARNLFRFICKKESRFAQCYSKTLFGSHSTSTEQNNVLHTVFGSFDFPSRYSLSKFRKLGEKMWFFFKKLFDWRKRKVSLIANSKIKQRFCYSD